MTDYNFVNLRNTNNNENRNLLFTIAISMLLLTFWNIFTSPSEEEIKKQLATAYLKPDDDVKKMMVYGRNLLLNIPQEIVIDRNDIVVSCSEFINTLIENLNYLLEMTPPELMKDIVKHGITICGGGAKISNLDYVIKEITGINVTIPTDPELCLINGLEKIVDDYKKYEHLLFKQL